MRHFSSGRPSGRQSVVPGKLFGTVAALLLLWGCGVDPDEARMRLGELGYDYHPRSLFLAAMRNDHAAIKFFVSSGIGPDTELDNRAILQKESENQTPEFREQYMFNGRFDRFSHNFTTTALVVAAALGNTETVAALLAAGADVNKPDEAQTSDPEKAKVTPLVWALDNGHIDTAKVLMDADADVGRDELPLAIAASKGDIVMVQMLLDAGADVLIENTTNLLALINAVTINRLEVLALLLEEGASANARDDGGSGDTALMKAARAGNVEAVKLLLEAGADPNLQNEEGTTALMMAVALDHTEVIALLLDAGADPDVGAGESVLMIATRATDPRASAQESNLPAEIEGMIDIRKRQLRIDRREDGSNATSENRFETVRTLLGTGVDPNARNEAGETVLMVAAKQGNVQLAEVILEAEPDVDIQDNEGNSALMVAAKQGNLQLAQVILEAEPNVDIQDSAGNTALLLAVRQRRPGTVRGPRAEGPDIGLVQALLNAGADPNVQDIDGFMGLMIAARAGNTEVVRALLDANADIDHQNNEGQTALLSTLDKRLRQVPHDALRTLLDAGADPNLPNELGLTPLMSAAAKRDRTVVQWLLDAGADPALEDAEGKTALDHTPDTFGGKAANIDQLLWAAAERIRNAEASNNEQSDAVSPLAKTPTTSDSKPGRNLSDETYLGGMTKRGMKLYALSSDGNWCAENLVFKIQSESASVFTDGTADFYMKRFGERINDEAFCPAAQVAEIYGYENGNNEPVFRGRSTADGGWAMN